ncbi:MAG: hypothetical protein CM1200mP26_21520 [Acidimicrobiales bacterium]|nr:MAG: hypothetical protein CM1200mP26_21520 [Acidimicrobiales bacterium]
MVSASHNPWFDNGIKLFAAGGHKLDDQVQSAVQETWDAYPRIEGSTLVPDWADPADPTSGGRRWVDALIAGVIEGSTGEQEAIIRWTDGPWSWIAPTVHLVVCR